MRGLLGDAWRGGVALALLTLLLAAATPPAAASSVTCAQRTSVLEVAIPAGGAASVAAVDGDAVVRTATAEVVCRAGIADLLAVVVSSPGAGAALDVRLGSVELPQVTFALRGTGSVSVTGTPRVDALTLATAFAGARTIASISVEGGAGDDRLDASGWDGAVALTGGDGDDRLIGGDDDDVLLGGAGDDTLEGRAGADRIDGGAGADRADYSGSPAAVRVDLAPGATNAGGHAQGDGVLRVEDLIGSRFGDILRGDGRANALLGGGGGDLLEGRGGADLLSGGLGTDVASYASSSGPVVANLGGQSRNAGADALGDVLIGLEGLIGSRFGDVLTGDGGRNRLLGGGGDDVLDGAAGDDTLLGGPGDDLLIGGEGTDTASYAGSTVAVTVDLTRGLSSGQGSDDLFGIEAAVGGDAGDLLVGSAGPDRLVGGPGPDVLRGRGGPDVLEGGPDADLLDGGPGTDRCDPGTGADRLVSC